MIEPAPKRASSILKVLHPIFEGLMAMLTSAETDEARASIEFGIRALLEGEEGVRVDRSILHLAMESRSPSLLTSIVKIGASYEEPVDVWPLVIEGLQGLVQAVGQNGAGEREVYPNPNGMIEEEY